MDYDIIFKKDVYVIKILKYMKAKMMKFYYLRLPFLSSNIKRKSFYKFVEDGYTEVIYKDLVLTDNAVVFDVGGFRGEFTDEIQKSCDCNIYIFEPVKEYFDLIVEKQQNNTKVHVYNYGLGGAAMDAKINKLGASSSVFIDSKNNDQFQEIKIESITEFIWSNNIYKIDLIKINIEGGEYDLLDSLVKNQEIINSVNTLLIQFHDFIPDAAKKRNSLQEKLISTHQKVFDYPFIWEKWQRVKGGVPIND